MRQSFNCVAQITLEFDLFCFTFRLVLSVRVFYLCISICVLHVCLPTDVRKGIGTPAMEVMDDCELPYGARTKFGS